MKKYISIVLIIIMLFGLTACKKEKEIVNDAVKFKEEYEKLNNKVNKNNNKKYRSISIPKNNPFIYKSAEEIVDNIKNKETFIVYFGFNTCPWCRSVLESLVKAANDNNVGIIYYVDILNIRDVKELDENGNIKETKEGSNAYLELIELLKDVLDDYTLEKDKKEISVGEKRIYAPNVVAVSKGKAVQLETGISDDLTDPYMKLTQEIKNHAYNKFKCLIKCLEEESTTCKKNSC